MPDGNANQRLLDDQVRRRIALERYSNGQVRKTLAFLKDVEGDILAKLAKASPTSKRQLEALLKDVREIHNKAYAELETRLGKEFSALAGEEARFQSRSIGAVVEGQVSRLTTAAAFQAANTRPMEGALLKDWMRDLSKNARSRVEKALRISYTEGENLSNARQRLKAVIGTNRRGAEALIRTANTHISASVQQATYEQNADLIDEVEWRSVLDSRTTFICASRDGERYPLNSGPRPPAHISCRSVVTPVLKDAPPPQRETYDEWIKRQPADVQDDILGPTRAKLLRDGKADMDSFVDLRGKTKTLKQLGAQAQ